jgi:ubiquinone/menaquinone biosynthesis C-methylase UbiE
MAQASIETVDFEAVKRQQQATWASGDYSQIGTTLLITSELLCEAAGLQAGERVLDIATGNGNTALAAARRGAEVIAIDYVPELLERGRLRAAADGLAIDFREGDLERLPFAEGSFDLVLSTFGVMFSPGQEQAADELLRVCRPGGRIAMANWTPEGFVGQMLRLVGSYAPPPAGVRSPALWGTEARVRELFAAAANITIARRHFTFRFRSAEEWLHTFRSYYGPMVKAFGRLDPAGQEALARDLLALGARFADGSSGAFAAPGEYLEVVMTT